MKNHLTPIELCILIVAIAVLVAAILPMTNCVDLTVLIDRTGE